jgi:hypothetical protein
VVDTSITEPSRAVAAVPTGPTTDCATLHALVVDHFPAIVNGDVPPTLGSVPPMGDIFVLVFDANGQFVRGMPAKGTVGIRVEGDTRSAETVGEEQGGEGICGPGGTSRASGGGGGGGNGDGAGLSGASGVVRTLAAPSLTGTVSISPSGVISVNGFVQSFVPAAGGGSGLARGLDSATALIVDRVTGLKPLVSPSCCAPWNIDAHGLVSLQATDSGLVRRNFLVGDSTGYFIGIETYSSNAAGTLEITPPNQARGLTSPEGGSSGIQGVTASQVASVEEVRFVKGELAPGGLVHLLLVSLTPHAPHQ